MRALFIRAVLAGAAFITLAYAGLSRVSSMARRISVLRSFALDIRGLDSAMTLTRLPLKNLVGTLSPCALPAFWQAFSNALSGGAAVRTAFDAAFCEAKLAIVLSKPERAVLEDFFTVLGHTELSAQNTNAKSAVARLERLADALEAEKLKRGGLYGQLGIFGGLAAALILI